MLVTVLLMQNVILLFFLGGYGGGRGGYDDFDNGEQVHNCDFNKCQVHPSSSRFVAKYTA